jgi:hypothetical protein
MCLRNGVLLRSKREILEREGSVCASLHDDCPEGMAQLIEETLQITSPQGGYQGVFKRPNHWL